MATAAEQFALLKQGTVEIVPEDEFRQKLERSVREKKPLRVKQGFDPTAPDIHLGHTIGLMKLKQFQDLGHQIVLIVGDYTAQVGDPSERSETRPRLTHEAVKRNAQTYLDQFGKVLDMARTEVRWNGEWFSGLAFSQVLELAARFTTARILERDDFAARLKAERPVGLHELFYVVMQAHDSVVVRADVELGGTEQKFNLLAARDLQRAAGQEPQIAITLPILTGTDGSPRMSKSLGNYIGVNESPTEQFGKTMSTPDENLPSWYLLLSGLPPAERDRWLASNVRQRDAKENLAKIIVARYHGAQAAEHAADRFRREHSEGELPEDIPPYHLGHLVLERSDRGPWLALLVDSQLASSRSEARRLIEQKGVTHFHRGEPHVVRDPWEWPALSDGDIVRVGRRFRRISLASDQSWPGPRVQVQAKLTESGPKIHTARFVGKRLIERWKEKSNLVVFKTAAGLHAVRSKTGGWDPEIDFRLPRDIHVRDVVAVKARVLCEPQGDAAFYTGIRDAMSTYWITYCPSASEVPSGGVHPKNPNEHVFSIKWQRGEWVELAIDLMEQVRHTNFFAHLPELYLDTFRIRGPVSVEELKIETRQQSG